MKDKDIVENIKQPGATIVTNMSIEDAIKWVNLKCCKTGVRERMAGRAAAWTLLVELQKLANYVLQLETALKFAQENQEKMFNVLTEEQKTSLLPKGENDETV